jgi:hypothetical protein
MRGMEGRHGHLLVPRVVALATRRSLNRRILSSELVVRNYSNLSSGSSPRASGSPSAADERSEQRVKYFYPPAASRRNISKNGSPNVTNLCSSR